MSAEPTAPASASGTVTCGACSTESSADAKFCSGCGHPLYEPCLECSKPVLLTQAFCGHCGTDLSKTTAKMLTKYEGWLVDSVKLAKEDEFEEAIGLLTRLTKLEDFRYREVSGNARQAIEKVRKIAAQRKELADTAAEQARAAIASNDHRRVIAVLEQAPLKLLPDELVSAYQKSRDVMASHGSLESEVQQAIAQRDWLLVGPLLDQLIDLEGELPDYVQLAEKVGGKLVGDAQKAYQKRKYDHALRHLDSVPSRVQNETYQQLRAKIEDTVWLRRQFEPEPFDTPTLGRLAVRLRDEEPNTAENEDRIKQISANLKKGERPSRGQYPLRLKRADSWIGQAELSYLSSLTKVKRSDIPELRSRWGQMNVAFGLALQGLGEARVSSNLVPKKGLLKRLTQKKATVAYGIDIGTYSIKVVGLQRTEEGIEMITGSVHPYENPVCRPGFDDDALGAAATLLEEIKEQYDFEEAPIWINMPSSELITRFTLLPPVPDKRANQLLDGEIKERIPLELNELTIDRWMAPYDEESAIGRPAIFTAIKNTSIEQRLERLGMTDLNIEGMQADPLALVNLLDFEFSEELGVELEDETKMPTYVLVDCGARTTTMVFVSRTAHWVWTVEYGGEDLTAQLARETKKGRKESDTLKASPHQLPHPAKEFAPIEVQLDGWRSRLKKLADEAMVVNPSFEVTGVFGCGGTTLTHQWFRRVLSA